MASALVMAGPAWAFWTATADSSVSASAASLAPVTNLQATPVSSTEIDVTWSLPADEPAGTTVAVYRDGASTALPNCSASPCKDQGLASGTSHSYSVVVSLYNWQQPASVSSQATSAGPTVSSITRDDANPTTASSVHWTVNFSTPVTGLAAGAFTLTKTGTANGTIGAVAAKGAGQYQTAWSVTVGSVTGSGTLRLDFTNGSNVKDTGGTAVSNTLNGDAYTVGPASTAAPTITGLTAATDSGVLNSDGITNVVKPTVAGTTPNVSSSTTITVYDGTTQLGTTVVSAGGTSWTLPVTTNLSEGPHSLTAKATVNGVTSASSTAYSVVIDTTPPSGLTVSCQFAQGSNYSCSGNAGSASGDSTTLGLVIKTQPGGSSVATFTVTRNGSGWTQSSSNPSKGTYVATLTQSDVAGNSFSLDSQAFTRN